MSLRTRVNATRPQYIIIKVNASRMKAEPFFSPPSVDRGAIIKPSKLLLSSLRYFFSPSTLHPPPCPYRRYGKAKAKLLPVPIQFYQVSKLFHRSKYPTCICSIESAPTPPPPSLTDLFFHPHPKLWRSLRVKPWVSSTAKAPRSKPMARL